MGAKEHKLVTALDKVLSGTLLAGSVLDVLGLLGWFDAKSDFIRLSHEYAVKLSERRSGLSRYDRTQRLQAAHTVIVLTSFFEAFDALGVGARIKDLELSCEGTLPTVPQELLNLASSPVPLVTPDCPYEANLSRMNSYYQQLAEALQSFLAGLSVWDVMNERERAKISALPAISCQHYEENIRRLAADCPEFAFWSSLQDHQATRTEVRRVGTALAEVERRLVEFAVGGINAQQRREELAARYRSILDLPIIEPDEVPDGLKIPIFRDCYIDPCFQVGKPSNPARTHSWEPLPVRSDVHDFFVGYLTSPKSIEAPLLVLGDPGSGKSVLTKVLAARLPVSDFVPLRVELRTTPAEADLLQQIEHGLAVALQEKVAWAEWSRSAAGAIPVVFLDGFDELLQATGVSQTGYIKKVQQFQKDCAVMGRPVAVVITSRISVADRATIPEEATVMRMVPFSEQQASQWLDAWNAANTQYFESAGLMPLDMQTVLAYSDLSEQPLLLLMLALYDADGNSLQQSRESISQAALYERLLIRFARREVIKDARDRSVSQLEEEIEAELERLSVVALGMFNRGAQWIVERELDRDLSALVGEQSRWDGSRTPLGAGEAVLGRFFFVQRAEALRDETTLRTYEFLHATFGEYLVARITWITVRSLLQVEKALPRLARNRLPEDNALYVLLSFESLSSRSPIVRFLQEMFAADNERFEAGKILVRAFQVAYRHRARTDYEPVPLGTPARNAAYSANLVLLSVIANGSLLASELFGSVYDVQREWSRNALLWKSQLKAGSWSALVKVFDLSKVWRGSSHEISISVSETDGTYPEIDILWLFGFPPEERKGETTLYGFVPNNDVQFISESLPGFDEHSLAPAATGDFLDWRSSIIATPTACATPLHALLRVLLSEEGDAEHRREMWDILGLSNSYGGGPAGKTESVIKRVLRTAPEFANVIQVVARHLSAGLILELVLEHLGKSNLDLTFVHGLDITGAEHTVEFDAGLLDASLRLYERGDIDESLFLYCPWLDVRSAVSRVSLVNLAAVRPDLIKRARTVAIEQRWYGEIEWP
jgi:hypothetical protein